MVLVVWIVFFCVCLHLTVQIMGMAKWLLWNKASHVSVLLVITSAYPCFRCSQYILKHLEATGRSQHSARCSKNMKIWIMLITPRISIPWLSHVPLLLNSPLSWDSSCDTGFVGGVVLPAVPDQQDCAGCQCLDTFIPQSGKLTIEPCARGREQAPQSQTTVCRRWNPRGLSERTIPSLHLL